MFDLINVKGNTFCFEGYTNVGLFINEEGKVILIDSCDHKKTVKTLDKILEAQGLKPDIIINTHGHVDHIAGNRFFSEKYGAEILATGMESCFIKYTKMEPDIFYNGISVNKKLNPYYQAEPSEPKLLNKENLPKGIEIIPLPGHAWEMVAVRTADNVLFLADSLMSVETWETHKLPYFGNVNLSIATLEMVKDLKADYFVPSHSPITTEIEELALYNIEKLKERKETVLSLIGENSAEETFPKLMEILGVEIKSGRFQMYFLMHKHFIEALIDEKLIEGEYDGKQYLYHIK